MRRIILGALLLLGFVSGAHAACSVPNPNILGPPFVDNCALPASALNGVVQRNVGNFYNPTGGYAGLTAMPVYTNILGSVGTPDATLNATEVFSKVGTGQSSGSNVNATVYISGIKTATTAGYRATGLMAEGIDTVGGDGSFVEGGRFQGTVNGASGQANGVICSAQSGVGIGWDFLIGCEADIENNTSDAPATINLSHYAVGFLASNGAAGTAKIADAGFATNNFNSHAFRVGFDVLGGVSDAAFRILGTQVYGIDMRTATPSFAAIEIPNASPIRAVGVSSAELDIIHVPNGANNLVLGTDTQGITLPAVSAPGTPGSSFVDVYLDGADQKLKSKDAAGQVWVLGTSVSTPATSSTTCTAGTIVFDASFIYTCYATNTWKRLASGATW